MIISAESEIFLAASNDSFESVATDRFIFVMKVFVTPPLGLGRQPITLCGDYPSKERSLPYLPRKRSCNVNNVVA